LSCFTHTARTHACTHTHSLTYANNICQFGLVYLANMAETVAEVGSGNEKLCAVKMLRSGATTASKAEFLREAYVHTCMLAFFLHCIFGVHMNITMNASLSTCS